MNPHLKGTLITALGIILLSPDSLIIRLVDADKLTILFWRGLFTFEGMLLVTAMLHGRNTLRVFKAIGWPGIGAALMFTLSSFCFVNALVNTSVANTLVILSTSPVFAAILGWLFLKEKIEIHTIVAIVVVIAAVTLIVSGSYENGSLLGDLFAMGAALFVASTFVFTRKKKDGDMTPAVALSGLMVALIAAPSIDPFDVPPESALLLLALGAVMTIALTLMFIGPRYIPAAEVSLMLPLETVCGTLIVWLIINEVPNVESLIGGGIIIIALFVHAMIALRRENASAVTRV
ncbi:MAG: DMT family transporter [Pseudomonadota bacterium]